jgi:hypothetical protein
VGILDERALHQGCIGGRKSDENKGGCELSSVFKLLKEEEKSNCTKRFVGNSAVLPIGI